MKLKTRSHEFLGLVGIGALMALTPLACGSDDGDSDGDGGNTTGGTTAGKSGSSTGGTKAGSGGSANQGGAGNGGDAGEAGAGEAGAGGAGAPTTARIRVVHASANAPDIDIYPKDGPAAAITDFAYGDATDFIEVAAGTVAFDLRAAGEDAEEPPAFTTDPVELTAGSDYTFIAAGEFAAIDEEVAFRVLALEHDFEEPAAGEAVVRVVHATPAWSAVDLDVVATDGVDLEGLAAFDDVSNVALPADTAIDIAFQTAEDGALSKLILPELDEGGELFVIATGNPGQPFRAPANGFALLVVDQDGVVSWVKENPWLHLLHASDVSVVDIYDSGALAAADKLVDDLAAEALTAFQLPASATGYSLKAVAGAAATGAATALASGPTSTLEAGEHYLTYIAGDTIQAVQEQFDLEQPTKALLRGVHASTSIAATVDFGVAVSSALTSVLLPGIAPGMASSEDGVALDPDDVILGAATTSTTTPLLAEKSFTADNALVAGERGFLLLAGTGTLWLVDTSVPGWTVR